MAENNVPVCPECGASMVPMRGKMTGRGWNCSKQTWSKQAGQGGCKGVRWNRGNFQQRKRVERASNWPGALSKHKRTQEQVDLRRFLSQAPEVRGGRLLIVDAVAGSAKSWSMADCAEAVYQRCGAAVSEWYMVAFNVNARDSLEAKLPASWPNVGTINGTGGRWQGYSFKNYKPGKIGGIFADMVKEIPWKERPRRGPLSAFAERMRDMLVYHDDDGNRTFWSEAIARICCRFPALGKKLEKESAAEVVSQYLPACVVRSLRDGRVIDLTEQYARPALTAMQKTGWQLPWDMLNKSHQWTDDDVRKFAELVKATQVPQVRGVVIDEAQDLSPSQVVLFLAATWRSGELVLVGDDTHGKPGEADYKAGQSIFGWRGAGGGWLSLIPRIWKELTGETAQRRGLSTTFRVPPEGVEYMRAFCPRMVSSKPAGSGVVKENLTAQDAYQCWLELPEGKRALWLTRRNAPLGVVFMQTLKDRKRCCLRGGGEMSGKVDGVLFEAAGWYNDSGEYSVSLRAALDKMKEEAAVEDEQPGSVGDDSLAGFLLSVGEAILADPSILTEAKDDEGNSLRPIATVGNLKRFVCYFASIDAERVLSTVYRAKGDEADLVVVDDLEAINSAWNDDARERNSVAFVAGTRHKETLLIIGSISPPMADGGTDDGGGLAPWQTEPQELVKAAAELDAEPQEETQAPPVKVKKERKPRTVKPQAPKGNAIKPLSLFGDDE